MEKKISLPEIIIMIMLTGIADIFGIFSGLAFAVPVIGQILIIMSFFVSLFIWLIVQFWLIMRTGIGLKDLWYSGGSLFDVFSAGSLPLQTPALIITIFIANNPKLSKLAGLAKGNIAK